MENNTDNNPNPSNSTQRKKEGKLLLVHGLLGSVFLFLILWTIHNVSKLITYWSVISLFLH